MFCGLPLFGVMFLFLGSVELVHHEDQPFCSPRIWHLAGADPWVLLGIPSIRASHAFPVLTSLCFLCPQFSFSLLCVLVPGCPSLQLPVSHSVCFPVAYQVPEGILLQLDIEESTGSQSFYTIDFHIIFPVYYGKQV